MQSAGIVCVSVVVPVWNTADWLKKCLDSILGQTLQNIEIIAVNDCSTDNSPDILHEYQRQDRRISVVDLAQNMGVSAARNAGINHASGEYIAFVDSDDYLEPDFCEKLYTAAKSSGADIAKGNFKYLNNPHIDFDLNKQIRSDKNNFCIQFCSAIYRTDFLKDHAVVFPEDLKVSEDLVFAYKAALSANHVNIVDDTCIVINLRPGSATFHAPDYEQITGHYKALNRILEIAEAGCGSRDSFNWVLAFVFALFLRIAVKNTGAMTRSFVAAENFRLFKMVQRSKKFDSLLFRRYLDGENTLMYDFLLKGSPEKLDIIAKNIQRKFSKILRQRIQ